MTLDDFRGNTVFTVIAEHVGTRVGEIQERIAAESASRMLSGKLRCEEGTPLLSVERLYIDAEGRPLELARSWYRHRQFSIRHEIAVLG